MGTTAYLQGYMDGYRHAIFDPLDDLGPPALHDYTDGHADGHCDAVCADAPGHLALAFIYNCSRMFSAHVPSREKHPEPASPGFGYRVPMARWKLFKDRG